MKDCSLQQCRELTNFDSNMKSVESLKNSAGATDKAGGISGLPMKGACYPSLMARCSLKVIKKIRKILKNKNLENFEQSCFGPLLKLNQLNQLRFQGRLMGQLLLNMDTGLSSEERLVFRVHDSNIEFRPSDFGVMTSLHCYGVSEPGTPSPSPIHENVFQNRPCLKLKDVKKAFITASRENEGQGERTLKLALLYFLYGVLLSRNGRITKRDMKYLHLVEDLEKFNAFPWGLVGYEFLAKSILSIRGRMDGSKVAIKNFEMFGFTYALQTWAYEVMPSVATYCASCASNLGYPTPRILRWSATKKRLSTDYLNKLLTFGDDTHLLLDGIQISSEKKIKIIMGTSKWTTALSRCQQKKRKLKYGKDIMLYTGPTYPRNHPICNILLERNNRMRNKLNELKAEKLKSDKAIEFYKKKLEDLEPKVGDSAAAAEAEEEINKSLVDGKAQHEDAMPAEVDATHDHSVESGSFKRGSRSSAHSGAAMECSESDAAVQDNQDKESDIRGCSDDEVPEEKMAGAGCSDGEVPTEKMAGEGYSDGEVPKEKMAGEGCSDGEVPEEKMAGAGCSDVEVPTEKMAGEGYSDGEVPEEKMAGAGCSDGEVPTEKMTGEGYSDGEVPEEKMAGAGCSDGAVPKEKMACPSSAAGAGAVIIEISSDDETTANDVDSSDNDSCSDAHMDSLIAALQRKAKRHKMDV